MAKSRGSKCLFNIVGSTMELRAGHARVFKHASAHWVVLFSVMFFQGGGHIRFLVDSSEPWFFFFHIPLFRPSERASEHACKQAILTSLPVPSQILEIIACNLNSSRTSILVPRTST